LLGVAPATLIGEDHFARVDEGDRDKGRACLKAAAATATPWKNQVLRWRASDGTLRFLESNATPILGATGAVVGFRGADRDISDRKQAEAMKSDFVSFVTHQLRTPLAGIRWMLELAAEDGSLAEETRSYVRDALAANRRLTDLVNDLLNVSRLESGALTLARQPTDLGALTRSVTDELAGLVREKQHRLTIVGDTGGPWVSADPPLLRQVVLNLVSNAIKYTRPAGEVAIRLTRDGTTASWTVRDSGIGIPREAQRRLFEKFYRAENVLTVETEGTGLGLYLVRLIVEQWGGSVTCDSDVGRGSTFTVTFPTPETRA
jgi:PAS domain S-box-containing protein